jgi:formylglycine-generating enzyme required for sulfatase activity
VTVEAYRKCVQAKECRRQGTDSNCNVSPRKGRHPVNCVSFAQAFCAWVGGRLPTAAAWEYAAKGGESRIYPWGNPEPRARACWSGEGSDRESRGWENTCPVDAYDAGVSKHGLFDMAGNVAQWVADRPDGGYEQRGGAWDTRDASLLRASARSLTNRDSNGAGDASTGFRCVK